MDMVTFFEDTREMSDKQLAILLSVLLKYSGSKRAMFWCFVDCYQLIAVHEIICMPCTRKLEY